MLGAAVLRPGEWKHRRIAQPGDTHVALLDLATPGRRYGRRPLPLRDAASSLSHARPRARDGGDPRDRWRSTSSPAMLVDELGGRRALRSAAPATPRSRACGRASTPSRPSCTRATPEIDELWAPGPLDVRRRRAGAAARPHAAPDAEEPDGDERADVAAYSPELGDRASSCTGSRSTRALVEHDSATGTPAPQLAERLLRDDTGRRRRALDAALRRARRADPRARPPVGARAPARARPRGRRDAARRRDRRPRPARRAVTPTTSRAHRSTTPTGRTS